MRPIIKAIKTLSHYLSCLKENAKRFKPEQCIHCGAGCLWSHGFYERKPDRPSGNGPTLNPIPILRFYCKLCRRTCSVLPEAIPPRRWYLWSIQQAVIISVLMGKAFAHQVRRTELVGAPLLGGMAGCLITSRLTPFSSKPILSGCSLEGTVSPNHFGGPFLMSMTYQA